MGVVGVGPVGAPDAAVRVAFHQRAGQRHAPGVGRCTVGLRVDAVDAADLHVKQRVGQQRVQRGKVGVVRAECGVHPADVVDHHRHGAAGQWPGQAVHQAALEMYLQMQAGGLEPVRQGDDLVHAGGCRQVFHEVEAHAPKARRGQALQLRVGHVGRHQRDTQVAPAASSDGVFHGAVVKTVHGRLHDHAAADAQVAVQCKQRLLRRIHRREVAACGIRIAACGAEHMHMAVAGQRRQRQGGRGRRRVEGQDGGRVGCHARGPAVMCWIVGMRCGFVCCFWPIPAIRKMHRLWT